MSFTILIKPAAYEVLSGVGDQVRFHLRANLQLVIQAGFAAGSKTAASR